MPELRRCPDCGRSYLGAHVGCPVVVVEREIERLYDRIDLIRRTSRLQAEAEALRDTDPDLAPAVRRNSADALRG